MILQFSDSNLTHFRHFSDRFFKLTHFRQFSDNFLAMYPKNVSRSKYKCVSYLSVELYQTYFWHIYKSDTDSFLTQFLVLTHFRDISNSNLTEFIHISEYDSFPTHIWHISDIFLTIFCNWHTSESFQTVFGHISGYVFVGKHQ